MIVFVESTFRLAEEDDDEICGSRGEHYLITNDWDKNM